MQPDSRSAVTGPCAPWAFDAAVICQIVLRASLARKIERLSNRLEHLPQKQALLCTIGASDCTFTSRSNPQPLWISLSDHPIMPKVLGASDGLAHSQIRHGDGFQKNRLTYLSSARRSVLETATIISRCSRKRLSRGLRKRQASSRVFAFQN